MTILREQKLEELEKKALSLVWKANDYQNLVKRISMNCNLHMRSSDMYAHLRDLNARGTHLSDQVYQKLKRVSRENVNANYYVRDALARIGNRTMTQEEYGMLSNISDKSLIEWKLDEGLKNLAIRLNLKRNETGGVCWANGPYFPSIPRCTEDPFHEGYKR